jgi:transposase
MTRPSTAAVATLGIDIGKNVFHLIGLNERGAITLRQRLSRRQLEARLTTMSPCLVGMEACVGAHHLGRQLRAVGHEVRLMPPKYVRPYSKGQKNDYRDAEAIAEAVQRPTMKFVAIKTVEQLDLQALHRVRERLCPSAQASSIRYGLFCSSAALPSVRDRGHYDPSCHSS